MFRDVADVVMADHHSPMRTLVANLDDADSTLLNIDRGSRLSLELWHLIQRSFQNGSRDQFFSARSITTPER